MLALIHCPPELSREKVLIMCILHDLAELRVGDITPHDCVAPETKHALEDAAMCDLLTELPELLTIWRESELRVSPEARFLKQLDRLDLGLQAERYDRQGLISAEAAAEFRESAGPLLTDAEAIRQRSQAP
jgi:putative hydrolase of HD superfamily